MVNGVSVKQGRKGYDIVFTTNEIFMGVEPDMYLVAIYWSPYEYTTDVVENQYKYWLGFLRIKPGMTGIISGVELPREAKKIFAKYWVIKDGKDITGYDKGILTVTDVEVV